MELTISKIKKNRSAEIWILLREYAGKQWVDIREYFLPEGISEWKPTQKGIMVAPELLPDLIEALGELEQSDEVEIIKTFYQSRGKEIRVAISQYEKHKYGDIRTWYLNEDDEMKPAKGVTFPLQSAGALIKALDESVICLGKG